eukprot:582697-Hanusia_phi.AAC.4
MDGQSEDVCSGIPPDFAHVQEQVWWAHLQPHAQSSHLRPGLQLVGQRSESSLEFQPLPSIPKFLGSQEGAFQSTISAERVNGVYYLPLLSWPIQAHPTATFDSTEILVLPSQEQDALSSYHSEASLHNPETSLSSEDALPFRLKRLEERSDKRSSEKGLKKKKTRRSTTHLQHHGACYHCRHKKWRCSTNRPCEKCIVHGTAETCENPEYAPGLERPLASRRFIEIRDDAYANMVALKNASVSEGVNFALVRITWEIGMSVNQVLQALRYLPPSVKQVIDESVQAVQAHAQRRLMKAQTSTTSLKELMAKQAVGRISAQGTHREVNDPPEASDERWGHGRWLSIEYNKYTSTRKCCKVGSECAELQGFHSEEFLSRFAENNLPIHTTHFDMLCIVMDSICQYQQNEFVRYWRLQKHTNDPKVSVSVFVRCCIIRDYDALGRKIRSSLVYDYIDEDEFERLSNAQEQGNSNDLLAISLLPRRSFQKFMSEHKRELQYAGKLMDMRKTRSGKEKLDEFVKRLQQNIKGLMSD